MGMFDEIRSSFNGMVGYYQTKDLDKMFAFYYIDPAGQFWSVDYTGTTDVNLEYRPGVPNPIVKHIPSGVRGKVTPLSFTGTLNLQELDDDENLFNWEVNFIEGVLQSFFLSSNTKKY